MLKTVLTFDDLAPNFTSYSRLAELLGFLKCMNVPGSLFVIPASGSDRVSKERYSELLRNAQVSGHEIAMHGYDHRDNEFGFLIPVPFPKFSRQRKLLMLGKECLKDALGTCPVGFRAPQYRHSRVTLKALESLDFKYDSSKSVFKPTHWMRLRLRTYVLPKVTRMGGLLEIPVTADYTYTLNRDNLEDHLARVRHDFSWVKGHGDVFVMNNHLQGSGAVLFEFLGRVIEELRDETDFVRLRDLIY